MRKGFSCLWFVLTSDCENIASGAASEYCLHRSTTGIPTATNLDLLAAISGRSSRFFVGLLLK